ncbi:hypothetical protein ABIB68_008105 [Bradyrhizobium sp. F1.2.2]
MIVRKIPPRRRLGRRAVDLREIVQAIFYISVERLPMVSLVEGAPTILVLSTIKDSFQPWALAHSLTTLNAGKIET